MYERTDVPTASIWKPEHVAILLGSAALIAIIAIRKATKGRKKGKKK